MKMLYSNAIYLVIEGVVRAKKSTMPSVRQIPDEYAERCVRLAPNLEAFWTRASINQNASFLTDFNYQRQQLMVMRLCGLDDVCDLVLSISELLFAVNGQHKRNILVKDATFIKDLIEEDVKKMAEDPSRALNCEGLLHATNNRNAEGVIMVPGYLHQKVPVPTITLILERLTKRLIKPEKTVDAAVKTVDAAAAVVMEPEFAGPVPRPCSSDPILIPLSAPSTEDVVAEVPDGGVAQYSRVFGSPKCRAAGVRRFDNCECPVKSGGFETNYAEAAEIEAEVEEPAVTADDLAASGIRLEETLPLPPKPQEKEQEEKGSTENSDNENKKEEETSDEETSTDDSSSEISAHALELFLSPTRQVKVSYFCSLSMWLFCVLAFFFDEHTDLSIFCCQFVCFLILTFFCFHFKIAKHRMETANKNNKTTETAGLAVDEDDSHTCLSEPGQEPVNPETGEPTEFVDEIKDAEYKNAETFLESLVATEETAPTPPNVFEFDWAMDILKRRYANAMSSNLLVCLVRETLADHKVEGSTLVGFLQVLGFTKFQLKRAIEWEDDKKPDMDVVRKLVRALLESSHIKIDEAFKSVYGLLEEMDIADLKEVFFQVKLTTPPAPQETTN